MKIALASPSFPNSINDGIEQLEKLVKDAVAQKAEIICFPESYIPGYPAPEFHIGKATQQQLESALEKACAIAKENSIVIILPMDWNTPKGLLNVAFVISTKGEVLGYQSKNQLDPTEDNMWVPGDERKIFEVNNVRFGIAICHEGFRYPETVRWAAMQGAAIVFHPHFAGSNAEGVELTEWGNKHNPYYEKAMVMRAIENTIYFASVNYATKYQESASSLISPDGICMAHQTYGEVGIVVADINPAMATGFLAKRFKKELYA